MLSIIIDAVYAISFIVLTVILVNINRKQVTLEINNLKLQLFDKRYAVYKSIVNSQVLMSRFDYQNEAISGAFDDNQLNILILSAKKDLDEQTILSEKLFDDDTIHKKMKLINIEFGKVVDSHFSILKSSLGYINNPNEFTQLYDRIMVCENED